MVAVRSDEEQANPLIAPSERQPTAELDRRHAAVDRRAVQLEPSKRVLVRDVDGGDAVRAECEGIHAPRHRRGGDAQGGRGSPHGTRPGPAPWIDRQRAQDLTSHRPWSIDTETVGQPLGKLQFTLTRRYCRGGRADSKGRRNENRNHHNARMHDLDLYPSPGSSMSDSVKPASNTLESAISTPTTYVPAGRLREFILNSH